MKNNEIRELGFTFGLLMILTSILITICYVYIAWQTVNQNPKFLKLRKIALAFATIGGTNFTKANLANANFTRANLKYSNFQYAMIIDASFYLVQNIEKVKISEENRKKWQELKI